MFLCSGFEYLLIICDKFYSMQVTKDMVNESYSFILFLFLLSRATHFQGGNVGILGSQTREAAEACLTVCPLLEDMAAWSQWELVFQPQFGPLRQFVEKYGGHKSINLKGTFHFEKGHYSHSLLTAEKVHVTKKILIILFLKIFFPNILHNPTN